MHPEGMGVVMQQLLFMYCLKRTKQLGHGFIILFLTILLLLIFSNVDANAQGDSSEWSPPIDFSNVRDLFSYAPVLLCDKNQNTHIFWVEGADQQDVIYYSNDIDGDWTVPNDILTAPSVNLLDAAIVLDSRVHLVWVTGHLGELVYTNTAIPNARDPRGWASPRSLDSDVNVSSNVYGGGNTLYADSAELLHLVYSKPNDPENLSNSLYYIRSEDNGDSWSRPSQVVTVLAPEPSSMTGNLAVDEMGRLHIAWEVRSYEYASFSRLGYIRSTDSGNTWGSEMELANGSRPFGVAMAAVFAFGGDEVHLTWDTPDRLHRWSQDGGDTWSAPVPIMGLGAAFGGFNKLAKDSAGTLHVISAVGNGVYHATWNGGGWNPKEAVETRSFDPHGQQFVICQGNRLHVAYYDRTGENEIWYSTKTTNAPELVRTAITASEAAPTATPLVVTKSSTTPMRSAATPLPNISLERTHDFSSTSSGMLVPTIAGVASAGLLVISVIIARLARRRR